MQCAWLSDAVRFRRMQFTRPIPGSRRTGVPRFTKFDVAFKPWWIRECVLHQNGAPRRELSNRVSIASIGRTNRKKLRKNLHCPQEGSATIFEIPSKPCRISKSVQHVEDATTPYASNGVSYASFGQTVKEFDSLRDPKTKNRVVAFFLTWNFSQTVRN